MCTSLHHAVLLALAFGCLATGGAWAQPHPAGADAAPTSATASASPEDAPPTAVADPAPADLAQPPAPTMTIDDAAELLDQPDGAAPPLEDPGLLERGEKLVLDGALALRGELPPLFDGGVVDLQRGQVTRDAIGAAAALCSALLLFGALMHASRGRGGVTVCLEYPVGLRGTFCVKLSKRSVGNTRVGKLTSPNEAERARLASAASSQTLRYGVSRETQFIEVPCRRHFVSVDGFLQTSESEDVVSTHFAEQEVRPIPGATVRLSFDFQPRACPVELRVAWDQCGLEEAQVARYGAPGSLRFARGPVQYPLDRGRHRLMAGKTDRVAEVELTIESLEPRVVVLDLGDHEQLLFTGCPRAVQPYLSGDIPTAARFLERDGQTGVANRLLGRFHEEHGRLEQAARHYEAADEHAVAAEIYHALQDFERAGQIFEDLGEDERAGEMFRSQGDWARAGEAYLRAGDLDSAVECFRTANDVPRWIDVLTKQGEHLAAARVALEREDRAQAILCLNRISVSDPVYPEAVLHLAEAYRQEGHADLAVRKLEDLISTRTDAEVPSEALDALALLCEQTHDTGRALELLEQLRQRDATWPGVANRVEAIRKIRQNQTTDATTLTSTAGGLSSGFGDDGSADSRYELLEELGRGGMGVVFRARDRRLGREVALKRLPDNIRNHPKAIELFLREARAAAALNHPNIVTLFDAGQENDTFYITMELLRGHPLQQILAGKGRLPTSSVAKLGGQVAMGLQFAHEQGIVHRDIKTANIFFTDKKVVKIMDFGLAKMVEEVRRSSTVIGGTPYYMAPEQSVGEQVDHRADLYALGVMFFELLTGSVPFKEGDVAFHHRHTPPPDLRECAGVPEEMAALVAGLLAKRPGDRIRSAREVVRRLAGIARASAASP